VSGFRDPTWCRVTEVESPIHGHLLHPVQRAAGSPQRYPIEDPANHQENLRHTELMACRDQLESGIRVGRDGRLGAGGDCVACRCDWDRSSLFSCSKAAALARHRSRDRRRSRTSVRVALIRACNFWYFAFQRSRLRSKHRASTRHGLEYGPVFSSLPWERSIACGSIPNN
jgi:hypothetical protein